MASDMTFPQVQVFVYLMMSLYKLTGMFSFITFLNTTFNMMNAIVLGASNNSNCLMSLVTR